MEIFMQTSPTDKSGASTKHNKKGEPKAKNGLKRVTTLQCALPCITSAKTLKEAQSKDLFVGHWYDGDYVVLQKVSYALKTADHQLIIEKGGIADIISF
jgi:hypothetical protein